MRSKTEVRTSPFLSGWLNRLLYTGTNNIFIQLFRYLFVGGTAFVIDFGLLAACTEFIGIPYYISATIGFVGGLTVNYILSIVWVFDSAPKSKRGRLTEFFVFAIIGVVGLGLNTLIIWFFTEQVGLHYLISKIISTITVFVWNFLGRRTLITYYPIHYEKK